MDQSAIDIKLKMSKTITDIGLDYGYTASNYSSAFKLYHRISPSDFREGNSKECVSNPFNPEKTHLFESFEMYNCKIKIEQLANTRVVYERVIGKYDQLKEKWFRFIDTYKDYIHDDRTIL